MVVPCCVPPRDAFVVLMRGDVEIACWPLTGDAPPDLSLVDHLARLKVAARRLGCSIWLRGDCGELGKLLDLVGLAGVAASGGLAVEVGGESEGGEEVGVQERVEGRDPIA
jgi:hypothetical protein